MMKNIELTEIEYKRLDNWLNANINNKIFDLIVKNLEPNERLSYIVERISVALENKYNNWVLNQYVGDKEIGFERFKNHTVTITDQVSVLFNLSYHNDSEKLITVFVFKEALGINLINDLVERFNDKKNTSTHWQNWNVINFLLKSKKYNLLENNSDLYLNMLSSLSKSSDVYMGERFFKVMDIINDDQELSFDIFENKSSSIVECFNDFIKFQRKLNKKSMEKIEKYSSLILKTYKNNNQELPNRFNEIINDFPELKKEENLMKLSDFIKNNKNIFYENKSNFITLDLDFRIKQEQKKCDDEVNVILFEFDLIRYTKNNNLKSIDFKSHMRFMAKAMNLGNQYINAKNFIYTEKDGKHIFKFVFDKTKDTNPFNNIIESLIFNMPNLINQSKNYSDYIKGLEPISEKEKFVQETIFKYLGYLTLQDKLVNDGSKKVNKVKI